VEMTRHGRRRHVSKGTNRTESRLILRKAAQRLCFSDVTP